MSWRIGVYTGRVKTVTKAQERLRPLLEDMIKAGEIDTFTSGDSYAVPKDCFQDGKPRVYRLDYILTKSVRKLVVEVDGASHDSGKRSEKDELRDRAMKAYYGYSTLRIKDKEIKPKNFPEIRREILEKTRT